MKTAVGLYQRIWRYEQSVTRRYPRRHLLALLSVLPLTGYRPIVEVMFADFLGVCIDPIVSSIAKRRFMSGRPNGCAIGDHSGDWRRRAAIWPATFANLRKLATEYSWIAYPRARRLHGGHGIFVRRCDATIPVQ